MILFLCFIGINQIAWAQTATDYFQKANEANERKDFKSALKSIDQALRLDSLNADYYNGKAIILTELERYQESYDTYSKAIALFPNKSFLLNNRGNLLLSLGEFDASIQDFTHALSIAENDTAKRLCYTNRAAVKTKVRDFFGAYFDLLDAYKLDSTDIAILTNLGSVCDEIGKGEETLKYLLEAVRIDPTFYPAYGNIGFKYQMMGQHEKAIEYFNKVLEMNPDEPLGYSNRSFNKLKLGDLKGAMKDIEKSIKLYPANSYAYRIRALIYIEEKEFNKACLDLQTAIDKGFTVSYGDEVINLQKKYCNK